MRGFRKSRASYPHGVVGIYDNGGKTIDRYTVVYEPYEMDGRIHFPYVGMSGAPYWPQGYCQHGEVVDQRPRKHWADRVVNLEDLPKDCQRVVLQDVS